MTASPSFGIVAVENGAEIERGCSTRGRRDVWVYPVAAGRNPYVGKAGRRIRASMDSAAVVAVETVIGVGGVVVGCGRMEDIQIVYAPH